MMSDKRYEDENVSASSAATATTTTTTTTTGTNAIASWDIPVELVEHYRSQHRIVELFEWQVRCLRLPDVWAAGRNLVFVAPTSAGKSLIADILLYRAVLRRKLKAIIILPFVSIAIEKVQSLKQIYRRVGIRIDSFAGSASSPRGGLDRVDVAVCTIEKANNMINKLIEDGRLGEIGIVIVDELHMLADSNRGYLLELLLTKIRYLAERDRRRRADKHEDPALSPLQIVGMSATISNLADLGRWLDAECFETDFRPVPLTEYIACGNEMYDKRSILAERNSDQSQPITIECDRLDIAPAEDAPLIYCAIETLIAGHSVLIFCPTKRTAEAMSCAIAKNIYEFGSGKKTLNDATSASRSTAIGAAVCAQIDQSKVNEVMKELRESPAGLDRTFELALRFGVAFHHAGLSAEERIIVENAFRRGGAIRILCCTTTLSAGVNLPARRVLISSPYDYTSHTLLGGTVYRQMSGRAGRTGIDDCGESILFCKRREDFDRFVSEIVRAPAPIVTSCLVPQNSKQESPPNDNQHDDTQQSSSSSSSSSNATQIISTSLKRAILEVIANGIAATRTDLSDYLRSTFFFSSSSITSSSSSLSSIANLDIALDRVFRYLESNALIYTRPNNEAQANNAINSIRASGMKTCGDSGTFLITSLGRAIVASGISPDDGLFLHAELDRAQRSLSLIGDTHLIYEVTPTYVADQLNTAIRWSHYHDNIWPRLNDAERQIADRVGVRESTLFHLARGNGADGQLALTDEIRRSRRFYAALALADRIREMPLIEVAKKYLLTKGSIQSLQQQVSSFAGMLATFCERLAWPQLQALIEQLRARISLAVRPELIDLMRIPLLSAELARNLYRGGIETLTMIVYRPVRDIEDALIATLPFEMQPKSGEPAMRKIFIANLDRYVTIREFAAAIFAEANQILQDDAGVVGAAVPRPSDQLPNSIIPNIEESSVASTSKNTNNEKNDNMQQQQQQQQQQPQSEIDIADEFLMSDDIDEIDETRIDDEIQSNQFTEIKDKQISPNKRPRLSSSSSSLINETNRVSRTNDHDNGDEDKILLHSDDSLLLFYDDDDDLLCSLPSKKPSNYQEHKLTLGNKSVQSSPSLDDDLANCDIDQAIEQANRAAKSEKTTITTTTTTTTTTTSTSASTTSTSTIITNEEELDLFQTFERTFSLPAEFGARETTKILPKNFRLIHVRTDEQCEQMLDTIFGSNDGSKQNSIIDVAIHFHLQTIPHSVSAQCNRANKRRKVGLVVDDFFDPTRRGLRIDGAGISAQLTELYFARSADDRVFAIDASNVFEYLRTKLATRIGEFNHSAEFDDADESSSPVSGPPFRFSTYDIKSALYVLQYGFSISLSALRHRIEWHDLSIAIWLLDPESRPLTNIDRIDFTELISIACRFGLPQEYLRSLQSAAANFARRNDQDDDDDDLLQHGDLFKTASLFHLIGEFCARLSAENLFNAYRAIEIPARIVIYSLQIRGVSIDHDRLIGEQTRIARLLEHVECMIFAAAGRKFNLNSPQAVASVLYDKMDLLSYFDVKKRASSGSSSTATTSSAKTEIEKRSNPSSGNRSSAPKTRSTSKLALIKLQQACANRTRLPTLIIEWRHLNHAYSQTIIPIRNALRFTNRSANQTASTSSMIIASGPAFLFNRCEEWTATGRISMRDPNLINVDKDFQITSIDEITEKRLLRVKRNEDDDNNITVNNEDCLISSPPVTIRLRQIIRARPRHILISADYSQLELRILTHFANDTRLLRTVSDRRFDAFRSIAAEWRAVSPDCVTDEQRQAAKQICYGMIYGMGDHALADKLAVTIAEAQQYRQTFFDRFPGIERLVTKIVERCESRGYVETIGKRRRLLPNIKSANQAELARAKRQAVNSVIQGSAADVIKLAMIAVDRAIRRKSSKFEQRKNRDDDDPNHRFSRASFIMQMYDELMYEVCVADDADDQQIDDGDDDQRESTTELITSYASSPAALTFARLLKQQMENVSRHLNVDLPVKVYAGVTWGDLREIPL